MANLSLEPYLETPSDTYPLVMERPRNDREHIIDIPRSRDVVSSTDSHDNSSVRLDQPQSDERPSGSIRVPVSELPLPSSSSLNSRNPSLQRRGDNRRRRSPLNSGIWISTELVLTVSQIVAAIVVLSFSRHEHPGSPLRTWIMGYASGCVAILPLLYWRYRHRNQGSEPDSVQPIQVTFSSNHPAGPVFSLSRNSTSEEENRRTNVTASRGNQNIGRLRARIKVLVEYLKMGLDCFFAIWFVVGNVWIFGGHTSAGAAPNLYRLCIVFLTFSCVGYAMPFILCATICCCLPCIVSVLGFREDSTQTRGATTESINALPTYKFKLKKNRSGNGRDTNAGTGEGVVAAGTDKERAISREDAACCICLANYANNDELRELPCSHFLHKDCVDKWLKINASCPLCKHEVGEPTLDSLSASNIGQ